MQVKKDKKNPTVKQPNSALTEKEEKQQSTITN